MLILNMKRFVKSPVFMAATICYIVVLYLLQPIQSMAVFYDVINHSLATQPFSFLYFMVISYEFFYQTKSCKLEETICVSKVGRVREKMYGFFVFLALDLIICAVYFIASNIYSDLKLGGIVWEWVVSQAKTILLYHFLLYLFAVLVGVLTSFLKSRIRAFGVLLLVFSVFTNIFLPALLACVSDSDRWTHVMGVFGIMNSNYYVGCDLYYMYSIEGVIAWRMLFWILLAGAGISAAVNKRKRLFLTGGIFLSACFMLYLYVQPSGYRYNGGWWDTVMGDQQYYSLLYGHETDGIARKYEEAQFKVLKFEGSLSARRELAASLDVTVDRGDLEEYPFTLYHGYKLEKICDENGESLYYEQDGDHILVKNHADKPGISNIHFEYAGYSRSYVATGQAIYLTGNFPYLPQPGWKEYMAEQKGQVWNMEYDLKGIGYKVNYDIQFDSPQKVYSNLTEIETAHFQGTSETASFFASDYIRKMTVGGCEVYYSVLSAPYYPDNMEKTKEEWENTMQQLADRSYWEGMRIFDLTVAGGFGFMYCFASDHVVAGQSEIVSFYPYYLETGEIPNLSDLGMYGEEGGQEN